MLYHNEPYDSCNLYGALQFASIIVFRLRRSKQNDKIWQSSDTMMLIVYAQKVCILHFGHLWNQRLLCRPVNLSPCAWAQSTLAVLSCPSSSSRLARRSSPRASPPETGTSFSVANICKWLNGCRWLQMVAGMVRSKPARSLKMPQIFSKTMSHGWRPEW